MTKKTKDTTAPSHIVWFAPEKDNAPWTRIGAQWPTKDGKSFRQVLNMLPVAPGRIYIRPNEPKDGAAE